MVFDPRDPAFVADPYPAYAELRALGPVYRHDGIGVALATTHAACSAVLRHRGLGRLWTDAAPADRFAAFNLLHRNSLLENEPPAHTRLRRLISAAFARGHVERLRPRVRAMARGLVDELADQVADGGAADLVPILAEPLPVAVIAELLGVPEADRPLLRPWSSAIVKMYEYGLPQPAADAAERASAEFADYLRDLADHRARVPADDLVTDLVTIRDQGDRLTQDELVATAVLLLMAGHEATVNVIANGTNALLAHPDQWRLLVADRGLVPTAVEELIRFDAPLHLFERTATEPVDIAGHTVEPGEKIAALLGSAARDPAVFAEPDAFDITRDPNPHLGFGAGLHYCVGAPLARLEIAAAVDALAERLPTLAPAGPATRRPEFVIRGLSSLPVTA